MDEVVNGTNTWQLLRRLFIWELLVRKKQIIIVVKTNIILLFLKSILSLTFSFVVVSVPKKNVLKQYIFSCCLLKNQSFYINFFVIGVKFKYVYE